MVLQIILRRNTTGPENIQLFAQNLRLCIEWIAHAIASAEDNTHVIRSQSSLPRRRF